MIKIFSICLYVLLLAIPALMISPAAAGCRGGGLEIGIGLGIPGLGSALEYTNGGNCADRPEQTVSRKKSSAAKKATQAKAKKSSSTTKAARKTAVKQNAEQKAKSRPAKTSQRSAVKQSPVKKPTSNKSEEAISPAKAEAPPEPTVAEEPKPQEQPEGKTAETDLFAAKDAALVILQQAARPLPRAASERLRAAIEATTQSLADSLKRGSIEVIRTRTGILADLLDEARRAQNEPVEPSVQISAARSTGQDMDDQSPQSAAALSPGKRIALVIGNSGYKNAAELANPRNDAKLISATLADLGFEVVEGEDLDKAAMERKVREFAIKQTDADVSLFFYAGHGMQVAGRNYLVPIDAQLEDATAINFETIDLDSVLGYMTGPKKTAIALLDACRDNPLARRFANAAGASRSGTVGRGLAMPAALGGGLLIGFATAPGEVALDGVGQNSPFTKALLKYLPVKGLEIQQLMTDVKADVYDATHGQQSPWHNSDLREAFFLKR